MEQHADELLLRIVQTGEKDSLLLTYILGETELPQRMGDFQFRQFRLSSNLG